MANIKISNLPVAISVTGSDSFPVVQSGVTKQATKSVLLTDLGTPASLVLTNATGLPIDAGTINTLPVARGGTGVTTSTGSGNVVLSASPTLTGTTIVSALTASGNVTFDGGAFVFNESGADKDARFEGDTDANLLFLDASTDRVGIGTAAPAAKLDVNGNTSVTGNVTLTGDVVLANDQYLYWGVGDGSAYVRGSSSSDYVSFGTVGVERMRLDSSGNVGIGTTSPQRQVETYVAAGGNAFQARSTAVTTDFGINSANDGGFVYVRTNHYLAFGTNNIERMRLDSSGNVGIGTTSPAAKLDVNGPASVTSFTGSTRLGVTVKGSTAATDYSGIDFSGNNQTVPTARIAVLSASGGSSLVFGTSNNYATGITNSALTIDFSGNLISKVNNAAPTLSTNSTMSFELTSNTSLKIVVRGTDGTTRSVSLTLA